MQTLEELAQYVRNTVPVPKAILQLRIKQKANGVTFIWQGVEFFINMSLQAFEVRGHTIYITGLSTLLQAILSGKKQNERKLKSVVEQITEVEILLLEQRMQRQGSELLHRIRNTIEEMVPRRLEEKETHASQTPMIRQPLTAMR